MLAKYVAEVVEKGLDNLVDNGGDVNAQVAFANRIFTTIISKTCFYTTGIYDYKTVNFQEALHVTQRGKK